MDPEDASGTDSGRYWWDADPASATKSISSERTTVIKKWKLSKGFSVNIRTKSLFFCCDKLTSLGREDNQRPRMRRTGQKHMAETFSSRR